MPTDSNDNKIFISRKHSGFSDYLDFNLMRTNAIEYLGPITSKYWTDYNVHDPGITILEVLVYALMDLGYRASFSVDDILARDPKDTSKDNNFFSPAQLLGCNPLTIIDFRKKLMDIAEVRNAWLEIDDTNTIADAGDGENRIYINGLYTVYIELEKDIVDFKTETDWGLYKDKVFHSVRQVLMAHRNLCEDFTKIIFLCKMPVGVCADIELRPGLDIGEVYREIVTALHDFFSPSPTYYTLAQLVEKNVSLDIVFSGRPYTGKPSYGFLLDEELPDRITDGEAIHISDVYKIITDITGVKAIRKLKLRNCDKADASANDNEWEFFLPPQFIPEFSLSCSAFRFFQNGQLLTVDLAPYNAMLQMNFDHQGKVIYPAGPPGLDMPMPNGNVREGLRDYYSIQNDFPLVYGIGRGGLPIDVSPARKSQALQLKGYLLFFDQLLADYLSQLSHIRDLFALNTANKDDSYTYFSGDVSSVPSLNDLIRFPGNTDNSSGAIFAFPVKKEIWDAIQKNPVLSCADRKKLEAWHFASAIERDNAVGELMISFAESFISVDYIETETDDPDKNQFIYCLSGPSEKFVLISKNIFPDIVAASKEVSTALFIGAAKENYSLISVGGLSTYTFNLVQSASSYYDYLKTILENKDQYTARRTSFLDHLMSRFAESFTDYALLSSGFLSTADISVKKIGLLENFLSNFPALSADRGRAGDYLQQGWANDNISGFEKRYKAYCGTENLGRHYLCNFEVYKYEEQYNIKMQLAGEEIFICASPFQKKETVPAARSLFQALSNRDRYQSTYLDDQRIYINEISFYGQYHARSTMSWANRNNAHEAADMVCDMFRLSPAEKDIWVSEYNFKLELFDQHARLLYTSIEGFTEEDEAWNGARKMLAHINDPKVWLPNPDVHAQIGKLYHNRDKDFNFQYIDGKAFKIYIQHDILGKPDRCSFEVLDQNNSFRFRSTKDFAKEEHANAACHQLLFLLANIDNYSIRKRKHTDIYEIWINADGEDIADTENEFDAPGAALEMAELVSRAVRQKIYSLRVVAVPVQWKFDFRLGLPGSERFLFQSIKSYDSAGAAHEAAATFHRAGPGWKLVKDKDEFLLEGIAQGQTIDCRLVSEQGPIPGKELKPQIDHLLAAKEEIYQMAAGEEKAFEKLIQLDVPSKQGTHVYRLVDKDHPSAFHLGSVKEANEAGQIRENLILKGRKGYHYLQLCLGGDNIVFVPGQGDQLGQYYYQLKCRNDYFSRRGIHVKDGELVLFESVKGFASSDEAQQAFQSNYLLILEKGMDSSNYGNKKFIGLGDRSAILKNDDNNKTVVLVPVETRDAFAYAALDTIHELMLASRSYPIRYAHGGKSYQFVMINDESHQQDWHSAASFDTAVSAGEAFDFFLMLLNYPGNYFIEYDELDCNHRIGLREVLAESVHTFKEPKDAWGERGVERFICITQSEGGFHMNMRKNCTYSYFVACQNHHAIHPCQYETAEKRDAARVSLYHAASGFPSHDWISGFSFVDKRDTKADIDTREAGKEVYDGKATLYGIDGKAIAEVPVRSKGLTLEKAINSVLDMMDAVWADNNLHEDEEGLYLISGPDKIKIKPADKSISLKKWEKEILQYAAYFPLTRKINQNAGAQTAEYSVQLKLPGFVDLPGTMIMDKDCGCPSQEPGEPVDCYVAWQSEVSYNNASAAWADYEKLLPLLGSIENYHPVFDCCCDNGYGIELHEKKDIVAVNPQYYFYPEMACDAVKRAKSCINAEGLEIVEHILLRPREENAENRKLTVITTCTEKNQCEGIWDGSLTIDPEKPAPLSFEAGIDPYSFIITLALPAWPERFRKKENRAALENILQREAPAHILLRILWLTPRDMCHFEGFYKNWLNWVSIKKQCGSFTAEKFAEFLFSTSFACLNDCNECMVPDPTTAVANPCFDAIAPIDITQPSKDWLSQINLLYCWADMACSDTTGWKIENKKKKEPQKKLPEAPPKDKVETITQQIANEPVVKSITETAAAPALHEQEKNQLINARLRRYRDNSQKIFASLHNEELAEKTERFLSDPKPSTDRFKKLMIELGAALKKSRGSRRKDINVLIENVIASYLDKISFSQGSEASFAHIYGAMDSAGFRITDPDSFYKNWDPDEMVRLVPGLDVGAVQSVTRGFNS